MSGLKGGARARTAVVLSDVHLSANVQPERESAVIELLARHPESDVVFLGDLFEFSSCCAHDPSEALAVLVRANHRLAAALRQHIQAGACANFVAGNHDAELVGLGQQVNAVFGPNASVAPWCLRWGDVHLEHGHMFDPDNAPLHPLALHTRLHESLGVALMRAVVVDLGAPAFAHAHDLTPARALAAGVRSLGWRLPRVVWSLAIVISGLTLRAAWGRWGALAACRREGRQRLGTAARVAGLSETTLQALVDALPTPTHASLGRMVWRLYLDVLIGAGVAVGCVFALLLGVGGAVWGLVPSLLYLLAIGLGRLAGVDARRYEPPLEALRRGSDAVVKLTGASRVVFGHTHVEYDDDVYFNLGSFGYGGSAGRPYALVAPDGTVTRQFLAFDCGQ